MILVLFFGIVFSGVVTLFNLVQLFDANAAAALRNGNVGFVPSKKVLNGTVVATCRNDAQLF